MFTFPLFLFWISESLSQELELERNARNAEMERERNARNVELDNRNGRSSDHERPISAEIDRNGRSHEYERHGRELVHSPELDNRHGRNMELENSRMARNGSMDRESHPRHEVARSVGSDTERIQPLRNESERKIPGKFQRICFGLKYYDNN